MHITILITCLLTLDTNDKKKKKKNKIKKGECIHIFYIISYSQFLFLLQVYI
jgi:hypothetical protein